MTVAFALLAYDLAEANAFAVLGIVLVIKWLHKSVSHQLHKCFQTEY